MKKLLIMLTVALAFCFSAMAAEDANGTWKATLDTPQGQMENTFVIKVDAGKVTGTISSAMMGSQAITNGAVDGDKIKFSLTTDFGEISYSGTVKGDEMKLTLSAGGGQFTLDMTAKRVKT